MKNNTTGEKWEEFGILPDPNPYGKWVSIKNHNRLVRESVRLAVQEAKAEEREKIIVLLEDKLPKLQKNGDYPKYCGCNGECFGACDRSYACGISACVETLKEEQSTLNIKEDK